MPSLLKTPPRAAQGHCFAATSQHCVSGPLGELYQMRKLILSWRLSWGSLLFSLPGKKERHGQIPKVAT